MTREQALRFATMFRVSKQRACVVNVHGDAFLIDGPTYAVCLNGAMITKAVTCEVVMTCLTISMMQKVAA